MDLIYKLMSKIRGREHSDALIFTRSQDKFWEGYSGETPYLRYPEMGSTNKKIVASKGCEWMSELCAVIDSLPYPVPMAFNDKGKVYANPELVAADTNVKSLNADEALNNPAAAKRRWIVCEPVVKEEYRENDCMMLDAEKAKKSPRPMDLWYFNVSVMKAIDATRSKEIYLLRDGNIDDFINLITDLMKAHIAKTTNYAAITAATDISLYGHHRDSNGPHDKNYRQEVRDGFVRQWSDSSVKSNSPVIGRDMLKCRRNVESFLGFPSQAELNKPKVPVEESIDRAITSSSKALQPILDLINCDAEEGKEITLDTPWVHESIASFSRNVATYLEVTKSDHKLESDDDVLADCNTFSMLYASIFVWCASVSDHFSYLSNSIRGKVDVAQATVSAAFMRRTAPFRHWCNWSWFIAVACQHTLLKCGTWTICQAFGGLASVFLWFNPSRLSAGALSFVTAFRTVSLGFGLICSITGMMPFMPFIIGGSAIQVLMSISTLVTAGKLDSIKVTCKRHADKAVRDIVAFLGWMALDFTSPTTLFVFGGAICLSVGVFWFVPSWMNRFFKTFKTQDKSSFVTPSPSNEKLQNIETEHHAGRSVKKIVVEGQKIWNPRYDAKVIRSVFHGPIIELYKSLDRNIVRCAFDDYNSGKRRSGHIFGYRGDWAITLTHLIHGGDKCVTIKMSENGDDPTLSPTPIKVVNLRPDHIFNCGNDISIIQIRGRTFGDISKHVSDNDSFGSFMRGMIEGVDVSVVYTEKPFTAKHVASNTDHLYSRSFVYAWDDHKNGKCALPLLANTDGSNGISIVGLHCSGVDGSPESRSTVLKRSVIEGAISVLSDRVKTLQMCSENIPQFDYEDPIQKSVFRFEDTRHLDYYGKAPGVVLANQESKLRKSYLHKSIYPMFSDELGFVAEEFYLPPMMKPIHRDGDYISPINIGVRKMNVTRKSLDPSVYEKCIDVLTSRIVGMLRSKGISKLNPFNLETAINGDIDDPFFRRVDASKSAGNGFKGKKNQHIPIVVDTVDSLVREPTSDLKARLVDILEGYAEGRAAGYVYTAQLKDEPRERSKALNGKTRLFYISPLDALVVARMYLGPFYTLMVEHGDIFCTAIGTDMHRDSDRLYKTLVAFSDLIMEGDYAGFDLQMPFDIGLAACTVIYNVLREFGYNDGALSCVRGILTDSMFPYVELLKDVFGLPALQPSGKYATAEDNSLRGILLLMYAWYSHPKLRDLDFFEYVKPLVYGDDLLAAVKPEVSGYYNGMFYSEFCPMFFGMTFTSTSKGDVTEPFVTPDRMSFLKRKFVFSDSLQRYVAKLDMHSILKTLAWTLPSTSVGECEQELSVLQSSVRELYFHLSEKRFTRIRRLLLEKYCEKFNMQFDQVHSVVPTFSYLTSELVCESSDTFFNTHLDLLSYEHRMCLKSIDELATDVKEFDETFNGATPLELTTSARYMRDRDFRKLVDSRVSKINKYHACLETEKRLRVAIQKYNRMHLESTDETIGDQATGIDISTAEHMVNIVDISGEVPYRTTTGVKQKAAMIDKTIISLDEYLARPSQILEFAWNIDSPVYYRLSIWDLFFKRPSIREKIHKYGLIRCNLHVKISVSGMPMHYGKLMVSYIPMPRENAVARTYLDNITVPGLNFLKYLSATPGAKIIDVKSNMPLEMELPYVQYVPACRLYNQTASVISAGSSLNDFVNMGELILTSLNDLKSVTEGASSVSVMVYVWATDVELAAPTNTQMQITTESKDERITGPIETAASSMADMMNMASVVPQIAPYARASAMMLRGVAQFASLFGFSVPTINTSPSRMKNEPFQNAVNVIGYDTGHRLTLDPKQELTVDPRKVAVVDDELSISSFCERMGLLDQFNWSHTDPQLTTIWSCAVNPRVVKPETAVADYYQPHPLAFAAMPFVYWRGDVEFTFQFVVSNFHRGKFGIAFDPNVSQYAINTTSVNMDGVNMYIVDIQEVQEITVCVNWMSALEWLRVNNNVSMKDSVGSLNNPTSLWNFANGYVFVFPITRCQSPDDSDVQVNVFIKSNNMNFNFIDNFYPLNMDILTESKDEIIQSTCVDLNPSASTIDNIFSFYFGERWLSFAQVFKRFHTTNVLPVPETSATWGVKLTATSSPYPLMLPNDTTNATADQTSALSYLRACFLGMSGGVRKRVRFVGMDMSPTNHLHVRLIPPSSIDPDYDVAFEDNSFAITRDIGTDMFVPTTNGGIEFEIPFYHNTLFISSSNVPYVSTLTTARNEGMRSYVVDVECRSGNSGGLFVEETACAEDFRLFRFVGIPPFSI